MRPVTQISLIWFDACGLCCAHVLPRACRCQQWFRIADVAFDSTVNVKYFKSVCMASNTNIF